MPIRFSCPKCHRQLRTARRKSGTRVVCPRCEDTITVPTDPGTAEIAQVVHSGTARASARPAAVVSKADDGPLFEREDFERLLEPAVKKAVGDLAPTSEPLPVSATQVRDEGITIGRGAIAALVVLMVVLLALAFVTGYLVGTR
jgi:hypothetical protein